MVRIDMEDHKNHTEIRVNTDGKFVSVILREGQIEVHGVLKAPAWVFVFFLQEYQRRFQVSVPIEGEWIGWEGIPK